MKWLKKLKFGIIVLGLIVCNMLSVHAQDNLIVVLDLPQTSLGKGKTMEVTVKLKNYDESYKDNEITTILLEVYCDNGYLTIDEESIEIALDQGRGMGFSHAQMVGANMVELQYLNVSDPLVKGTEDLLHFKITAKQDIDKLVEAIRINEVILQDGTKEVSERLEADVVTKSDDKVIGQVHIPGPSKTEQETSEETGDTEEDKSVTNSETKNILNTEEETTTSGATGIIEENLTTKESNTKEEDAQTEAAGTQNNTENKTLESDSETKKNLGESETETREAVTNKQVPQFVWIVIGVVLAAGIFVSIKLFLAKQTHKEDK